MMESTFAPRVAAVRDPVPEISLVPLLRLRYNIRTFAHAWFEASGSCGFTINLGNVLEQAGG